MGGGREEGAAAARTKNPAKNKDAVWRTPAVKGGGEKNGAQKATQKVLYNLPGLQRSGTLTTS